MKSVEQGHYKESAIVKSTMTPDYYNILQNFPEGFTKLGCHPDPAEGPTLFSIRFAERSYFKILRLRSERQFELFKPKAQSL